MLQAQHVLHSPLQPVLQPLVLSPPRHSKFPEITLWMNQLVNIPPPEDARRVNTKELGKNLKFPLTLYGSIRQFVGAGRKRHNI